MFVSQIYDKMSGRFNFVVLKVSVIPWLSYCSSSMTSPRRKHGRVMCLLIALASAHCVGGHIGVELLARLNFGLVDRGGSRAGAPPLPHVGVGLSRCWGWGCGISWVACLITVRSCACLSGAGASWWADVGLLLLINSPWPLFGLHWA